MTISLSSYSTGTVAVEQGSTTVVLSGAGAAWPSSWCKPGCQIVIAGEAQTNYIAAWTDDHTVELALPVARATDGDLAYSILITAPAFGTNLEAALTNIERIRLMSENAEIGDLLAVATAAAIWPAHDDLLAIWDKGDEFKIKPTTVNLLYRLLGSVMAKAADYTIEAKDIGQLVTVSAGGAARIIGLPAAATVGVGFTTGVKKIDTSANTVTIAAAGGDTIDGAASVVLATRFDVVWLRSDGANWHITSDLRRIAEGVRYDAAVETDADLVPYDDKPGPTATEPGFAVLIGNIGGTGRAGIKWKLSDNSADWSGPAYLAPTVDFTADPVDVVPFGTDPGVSLTSDGAGNYALKLSLPKAADLVGITVDTLPPGSEATAALIPAAGGYGLALGIPQGATGDISGLTSFWQGIVTTKADAPTSRAALGVDPADATPITSANDIDAVADGWYRWVSDVPGHAPTSYAVMLQRTDGGQPIQIVIGGQSPQAIYTRRKTGGTWEEFTEIGAGGGGSSWNYVINGNFTVNQRAAATKAQAVGVYGYDRWKGHANGLEQVIEALPAGEYTLTWSGGGTGTFAGTTAVSPIKATSAGGNASVIVPATATKVSLVAGDATASDPFVQRPAALEDLLCRRYCEVFDWQTNFMLPTLQAQSATQVIYETYIHPKRGSPTVSGYSGNNLTGISVICYGTKLRFTATWTGSSTPSIGGKIMVDAEF